MFNKPHWLKPTPTLTKVADVERLFKIMSTPNGVIERVRANRKADDALFNKLKNS